MTDRQKHKPSRAKAPTLEAPAVNRQRLSEKLYLPLVDHALPDALLVHDHYGRIIEVNAHASTSLGYSRAQLLAMRVTDLEQDSDPASAQLEWDRLKPGRPVVLLDHYRRADGSAFPVEIHFSCHKSGENRIYISIVRDISERKRTKDAMLRSELLFRKVLRYASTGIAITDWDGHFQQCNPAYCRLVGYTEDELKLIEFSTLIHPDDRETNLLDIEELKSGKVPDFILENRYLRKDGRVVWAQKFVSLLPDEKGKPAHILALINDITERKHVEMALAEREAQYRAVIETAADGFWMLDDQGRILASNEAYARKSGYTQEELLGMSIATLEAAEIPEEVARHVARVRQNGSDLFETWHRTKAGERWPVEVNTSYWPRAGRLFAFLRDISERRQAAQALQESEARFRSTFEQAAVGIAHVAPDGRWLRINRKLCDIVGYTQEELLTKRFQDISYPDEVEDHLSRMKQMLAGELSTLTLEKRYLHKNGSTIWINLTVALTRTPDGVPDYFISVIEDISERKCTEAALHALYAEMEQLTHFQIANQTAAAFAHELNQPLNAVASYSEAALRLLRAGNPRPDRLNHAIESSAQQAQRAGRVVREFLDFMNQKEVSTEALSLNSIVLKVLARVEADGFNRASFDLDLDPELPPVRGNRLQVEKVLINLIENSIEAMHDASLSSRPIAVMVRTAADEALAQVTVTDSGPGIDKQTLHRIFDPFFTTQPKGLGMGLAISRTIIESHGGQLWVDSQPGAGASFHFTLPFAE